MTKKKNNKNSKTSAIIDNLWGDLILKRTDDYDTSDTTFTLTDLSYNTSGSEWITTYNTFTTLTTTTTFDIPDVPDPFTELEEHKQKEEEEAAMRKEYPSLQEAYDNYQLVKKLVEDSEFDKTFENRYEGFSKK